MKQISRADVACWALLAIGFATPAAAGVPPAPGPLVGAGIASLVAIGIGYRALKRRIDR